MVVLYSIIKCTVILRHIKTQIVLIGVSTTFFLKISNLNPLLINNNTKEAHENLKNNQFNYLVRDIDTLSFITNIKSRCILMQKYI